MERQLVKHGESTLMISLPKKWLVKQNLCKGDSVYVIDFPEKLLITKAGKKRKAAEIGVNLSKADYEDVRTILGNLYRKGYEKVILHYDNPRTVYFVQLITKAIQGFEIIEQTENRCVIKNVAREISIDVKEMESKIINIIKTEFILVRDYLTKGVKGKENELQMLRDDCWKCRNMVYVHLKENLLSFTFDDYFTIHMFEHNASFLYWIYRSFNRNEIDKASPGFLKLYDGVEEYFRESIKKMIKKDKNYISYIMSKREELLQKCEKYASGKAQDRFLALYLGMLIQNIHNPKSLIS